MGLDVTVFKKLQKMSKDAEDYDFIASNYLDFKDRCKNLEFGVKYKAKKSNRMISYPCSIHNNFRRELAMLIGQDKDFWLEPIVSKELPFYEFFDFADNEGTIDWESSKNLYEDFLEYKQKAIETLSIDKLEIYIKWINVFKSAKENAVVVFS